MYVPFQSIHGPAKVWIYQADRKFSERDKTIISDRLKLFTNEWAAHGQSLDASFDIRYDQFIVLAVDEDKNAASGCSIDSSVRVMKELSEILSIDFFNRNQIAFKKGDAVELISIQELRQKYQQGTWDKNTLTFNNVIERRSQLDREWLVPAASTWLKRYMTHTTLAN